MSRRHLVELEDLPWWPAVARDLATDYLHFMESRFALHRPVVPLLAAALRETGARAIVDLCSGGAGPLPDLLAALKRDGLEVRAVLTDLYPNRTAFERAAAASGGAITFEAAPVDARAVPARLAGFRTIFNSFHHFRPADARAALRDAERAGQPIGVFEIPERTLPALLGFLFLTPLIVLLVTPFVRPFQWRRLLWTYLLPLVPFTCWWDGIVSTLRAYSAGELEALATSASAGYKWKAGRVPIGGVPGHLTYLIGGR